jgi:hypothetical protein
MIGVITAALAGSTVGLTVAAASERSIALALATAMPVAHCVLFGLLEYEHIAWRRVLDLPLVPDSG